MNAPAAPAIARILTSVSICRTFDTHRNVTVWAMIETWSDGETKVTTVGRDTMDPSLAGYILERIYDVVEELDDAKKDVEL